MGKKNGDILEEARALGKRAVVGAASNVGLRVVNVNEIDRILLPLYQDWQMMKLLRCTYTELKDQPYEEMQIFLAFRAGEVDGEIQVAENNKNK